MSGLVPLVATWNCLLQKWVFMPVGPSLAASLEPLAHRGNVASVSLFYTYYSGCYRIVYVNSFFSLHS